MEIEDMKNPIEIYIHVVKVTDKAILVTDDPWGEDKVWLPKSQIYCENAKPWEDVGITMPEWLAIEKGLV